MFIINTQKKTNELNHILFETIYYLENSCEDNLEIVEFHLGDYLGEDGIVR